MSVGTESIAEAFRARSLLVEHANWQTLQIVGRDAKTWLNGVATCEVATLSAPHAAFGLFLTPQGKIISELWVLPTAEGLQVAVTLDASELAKKLDNYLVMEDAELRVPASWRWFSLHGPEAAPLAQLAAAELGGVAGNLRWPGHTGALVAVPEASAQQWVQRCEARGVQLATPEQWVSVRVELGIPEFGRDYDSRDNPHEASLERRAISWSKGCYLGQEVVCMQEMRGKLKRRLVRVALDVADVSTIAAGARVTSANAAGEQEVGEVTSVATGLTPATRFALVRLKNPHAFTSGGELKVATTAATIVALDPAE